MTDNTISPRISVALAVYNGEKYLYTLLESLECQELKPFEIVVLDDCSSDSSEEIIRNFPFSISQLHYFRNEKNEGVGTTFKKIISLCSGDYIAFCDQDDIWMPGKLKNSYALLQKYGHAPAVVFTDLTLIDESGKIIAPSFWKYIGLAPKQTTFFDVLFGNIITGCTVLINKEMIGLLSQMPVEAIVYDHWIALIVYGFGEYNYIDNPTVYYRDHNSSVTNKQKATPVKRIYGDYNSSDLFLEKNFQQAAIFKDLYGSRLNQDNLRALDSFLGLRKSSFLKKWMVLHLRRSSFLKKFFILYFIQSRQ